MRAAQVEVTVRVRQLVGARSLDRASTRPLPIEAPPSVHDESTRSYKLMENPPGID